MALDLNALERHLCDSLCEEVRLTRRPDGRVMLRTDFQFPDGDRFPIHVSETGTGGIRLSDIGHTLMHLSYEHDIDAFLDGTRGQLIERIVGESGISQEGGVFHVDTPIDGLSSAIFRFGQALTRVYDLTFLSRSHVRSTFYDDLRDLLVSLVDEDKLEPDYLLDELANAEAYPVDYRIEGRADTPLFVYGVPNRDKARLATITLSHFNRHEIRYESLLIFEDQAEIPRLDLARLSDVGGEMISSLESHADLERKLLARVAA